MLLWRSLDTEFAAEFIVLKLELESFGLEGSLDFDVSDSEVEPSGLEESPGLDISGSELESFGLEDVSMFFTKAFIAPVKASDTSSTSV